MRGVRGRGARIRTSARCLGVDNGGVRACARSPCALLARLRTPRRSPRRGSRWRRRCAGRGPRLMPRRRAASDGARGAAVGARAPDTARVDLAGQPAAPSASARAFWSRSRGLVFTASNLPALPEGRVYQLWVLTGQPAPISAGLLTPDRDGRVPPVRDPAGYAEAGCDGGHARARRWRALADRRQVSGRPRELTAFRFRP